MLLKFLSNNRIKCEIYNNTLTGDSSMSKKKSNKKKHIRADYKFNKEMKKMSNEISTQIDDYKQRFDDIVMHLGNFEYICMIVAKAHIARYESDPTTDRTADKWIRLSELKYMKNNIDKIRAIAATYPNILSMVKKARHEPHLVLKLIGESLIPIVTDLQEQMTKLINDFHIYIPKNTETLELVKDTNPDAAMILVSLEQAKEQMIKQAINFPEGVETMDLQIEEVEPSTTEEGTTDTTIITTEVVENV